MCLPQTLRIPMPRKPLTPHSSPAPLMGSPAALLLRTRSPPPSAPRALRRAQQREKCLRIGSPPAPSPSSPTLSARRKRCSRRRRTARSSASSSAPARPLRWPHGYTLSPQCDSAAAAYKAASLRLFYRPSTAQRAPPIRCWKGGRRTQFPPLPRPCERRGVGYGREAMVVAGPVRRRRNYPPTITLTNCVRRCLMAAVAAAERSPLRWSSSPLSATPPLAKEATLCRLRLSLPRPHSLPHRSTTIDARLRLRASSLPHPLTS